VRDETESRRSVDIEKLDTKDSPYGRMLDDDNLVSLLH